ncbi:hypothetical protein ATY76_13605 [Rhizobium sp. R339]|uniref:hypothetical protein n=1 Tax=Rhizobium sp. R339 TaxID=1764273 RepID=UPI000B537033|nr:hypothetical protein [Rhizobium sp. R339]OWV67954.1 hypothetical protein ATY76_13605 [Rhizobium sp. R339]
MKLPTWIKRPQQAPSGNVNPEIEREKLDLQQELAQTVITFGRRRDRVHQMAVATLNGMKEGKKR